MELHPGYFTELSSRTEFQEFTWTAQLIGRAQSSHDEQEMYPEPVTSEATRYTIGASRPMTTQEHAQRHMHAETRLDRVVMSTLEGALTYLTQVAYKGKNL